MRPPARLVATALLGAAGSLAPGRASAEPPAGARAVAHEVTIRIEPAQSRFVARDVVTFQAAGGDRRFSVRLPGKPRAKAGGAPLALSKTGPGTHAGRLPAGVDRVEFEYGATLPSDVVKKDDLAWVAGDVTGGAISTKGAYLSPESGWYADGGEGTLARFDVTSYVPEPYLAVTQGGIPERSVVTAPKDWDSDAEPAPPAGEGGRRYAASVAKAALPTDGCHLSAGAYRTATRTVEGVVLTTYFYEAEAGDAPLWLDATEEVVRRYAKVLPPYPHPKFDVVENFFASGYGMPSYTLLGDEVVRYVTAGARRSGGKIPPGYVDHEYVHGWFGNGLFVDPADGNWCEALTTYFSNYYAKELESPEEAREHRRGVLERYAIRVQPEEDYPVREFRTKVEDKDNDVGYGKGSLLFHMLRRRLGDERFFSAVRALTAARVGTHVSWSDWLSALDGEWIRPWLERKGLPEVRVASASSWPAAGEGARAFRAEVRQVVAKGEEPWPATTISLGADDGSRWTGTLGPAPLFSEDARPHAWVEADPDYDLLRRIPPEDLPHCLNRTLEQKGGRVRWKGGGDVFPRLAARLAAAAGFEALPPGAPSPEDDLPLVSLVVASPDEVRRWPPRGSGEPRVSVSPQGIVVEGKTYASPQHALLFTHPVERGSRTTYYAMSAEAARRADYLPYYGWDQWVVFEAGRPVARGFLDRTPTGTRREATRGDETAARVDAHVAALSSDAMAGRRPGTPGHDRARAYLTEALGATERAADAAEGVVFPLTPADLASPRTFAIDGQAVKHRPLFSSSEKTATGLSTQILSLPRWLPPAEVGRRLVEARARVEDVVLLIVDPLTPKPPTEGLVDVEELLAPLFDLPSALAFASVVEWSGGKPGGRASPRGEAVERDPGRLEAWVGGRRQRSLDAMGPHGDVLRTTGKPVLWPEGAFPATGGTVDLDLRWKPAVEGRTVVRQFPVAGAPSNVVVCAHYDSHGRTGRGVYRGADDNASGVACVLEAVRGIEAEMAGAKRGLVVFLFDGEEWGLQGSRAIVSRSRPPPEGGAVVNVDSVGRVRDDAVHVIGLSREPALAAKAVEALATQGLRPGADVDRFAYEQGSDHWPFHRVGVPAITLWATDYATMDTVDDTPEKVDPVGVARVSKSLRALLLRLVRE